jgi:hypothetical protein
MSRPAERLLRLALYDCDAKHEFISDEAVVSVPDKTLLDDLRHVARLIVIVIRLYGVECVMWCRLVRCDFDVRTSCALCAIVGLTAWLSCACADGSHTSSARP